jgi:hypothetical protein
MADPTVVAAVKRYVEKRFACAIPDATMRLVANAAESIVSVWDTQKKQITFEFVTSRLTAGEIKSETYKIAALDDQGKSKGLHSLT